MQGVYHVRRKFKREYIMSRGNLSRVYHFYTMAVTACVYLYQLCIYMYIYVYQEYIM